MTAIALRGIAARKLRVGLTALAVTLGVAMIAGSYVLTDTINSSFDKIFEQGQSGVDVAVVPHKAVDTQEIEVPPLDGALFERARQVEGVKQASGGIFGTVSIIGKDGKPLESGGAPNFAANAQPEPFNAFNYVQGRAPRTRTEAAIDRFTAEREKFEIGDRVGVVGDVAQRRYLITGIAKFGDVASFGGASVAVLTLPEAQLVTGKVGKLDEIDIEAAPGVSPDELKERVRRVMPLSVDVRTGQENANQQSEDSRDALSFLQTVLLVFAAIALLVGAFIIFNTFSITVAQRTRELALLRTLGATRRQVLGSVVAEAFVIGFGAAVIGLLAGIGYAKGVRELFKSFGIDLPSSGTVIETRTIVVSLIVGTVVTVVASLSPALRATRVSPVEALREGVTLPPGRGARFRTPLNVLLLVGGLALMLYGLFGVEESGQALPLLGLGSLGVFLGVGMWSPRLVRPIASVLGAPMERLRGITGKLARENSMRNPGRTAATAAAMMIGLAVVTFVATFAAGLKAGINDTIDKSFAGDLIIQNETGFEPIPPTVARDVQKVDGVKTVTAWRSSASNVQGVDGTSDVTGLDPRTAPQLFEFDWHEGSPLTFETLGPKDAVIDRNFGEDNNIDVGDKLRVTTPTGKRDVYTVRGSINDNADFVGDYVIPLRTIERDFDQREDLLVLVDLQPAASVPAVRADIKRLLDERYPTAENLDQQGLKDKNAEQFDQLLALVYALLSLAVVVSLFGIVNTLVLSIYERTRELGMLRAIGMSRRQVRRVIRYESVITALMGAVLGTALGVLLAAVISRPIGDEGFVLTFPVASIIAFLVLAGVAGVLSAIPPARRASRLDVLEALAYE